MDITVGKVTEPQGGAGAAAPSGAVTGLVVAVRSPRRSAPAAPPVSGERRREKGRPDPARSIVLTILLDDAAALPFRIIAGTTRMILRQQPRSR
ncbi:MAG: hypothetical protein HY049_07680 [Acidobacteria bacterium]|nr:hypothetical protein [Acidobacteriota bacterium]